MVDVFKPLQDLADLVVYNVFKLSHGTNIAEALNFFIYDTLKIFILILIITFIIGMVKSFFTPEKTRKFLSGKKTGVGNFLGASLGVVTPFCSCSAVPLFIGFVEAGIPLGITFSYLIAAPMINEVAIVILWGIFGIKVTAIYIFSGLIIAIVGGIILGLFNLDKYIESFVFETKIATSCCVSGENKDFKNRLEEAKDSAISIFKKIWIYVIIGVGIGAFLHGYVPTEFLMKYAGADNLFAVPLAVVLGVPLYGNCAGILPLSVVLVEAGLPIGTVLAFTMAVTAISFPELLILKRVLKLPLLIIFVSIITAAIIFTGYLFNFIL